jgi:magnesium transporter
VLLAFFVPAVVYMADAVGTQTEAIVIRGISVGVRARESSCASWRPAW